jgi:hypothetical protein
MTGTHPPLNHAILIDRNNPKSAIAGLSALGDLLESGQPVIVGVDYRPGSPNADKITDQYVVIAGYGEDSNGNTYLRFFDPGTAHFENGTSPTNRFYIDDGGFLVAHTAYSPGRVYTISQVRLQ